MRPTQPWFLQCSGMEGAPRQTVLRPSSKGPPPPRPRSPPLWVGLSKDRNVLHLAKQPWASCSFHGIKRCPLFRNIILISNQWKSGQKLSDQGQGMGGGVMAQGAGVPPSWPPTPCPSPTPGLLLACLDSLLDPYLGSWAHGTSVNQYLKHRSSLFEGPGCKSF